MNLHTPQLTSKWNGGITPAAQALFEQTSEWKQYQDELLEVARLHTAVGSEAVHQLAKGAGQSVKTLGERLDEACIAADISHEELAHRIGLSRTTYFAVKAGTSGRKSRRKTELYLTRVFSRK